MACLCVNTAWQTRKRTQVSSAIVIPLAYLMSDSELSAVLQVQNKRHSTYMLIKEWKYTWCNAAAVVLAR
jgi:hypothetical protein